ncbi:MAG: M1 family metallopeptidase, partial [Bacteroidetes bacterium]|nr:M1 family metallopeptidase [Bacteroidota bacterium]
MKNLFVLLFVTIFVNHLFAQKISDFNKPNFENKHFETTGTKSVNSLLDNYDVKFYKIEVDVTNTSKTINSGIGTMYAQVVNNPLNTILLEL